MNIIIVGNGIAGYSAAETLRKFDNICNILMISAEPYPLYSPCVLPKYISGELSRECIFIKSKNDYNGLNIKTLFGRRVLEIDIKDKRVVTKNGETFSFDKLILATGSEAIAPLKKMKGIFKIKTLRDAERLLRHNGRKAVVIGAGAIGIEMAVALHSRGYDVKIIEMMSQVLPLGLDPRGGNKVKEILERHAIEVFTGERAEKVFGKGSIKGLSTDKRELECDTLLWAIGIRPSVELARGAGIEIGERGGIKVNDTMETSISDIYACGDCVESNDILTGERSLNLFWHNANRQGSVAARNCLGIKTHYLGSQNLLNVNLFGNHIVGFGFTEEAIHRFKDIKTISERYSELKIIERERDDSYFRLVILGDRCMGGQFINMGPLIQDLGLLWSIIFRKRDIKELYRIFDNKEIFTHRPWFRRINLFLK